MWQRLVATGGILIAANGAAFAADTAPCAGIADPAARLACYDRLNAPTPPAAEPSAATPVATAAPAADPQQFGAETLPRQADAATEPDSIQSRISGRFTGWSKDSEFRLDNGQVWRCVDCRDVYHTVDNPAVTVKRNFIGSYWLKIEGLNSQARVKRVK